MDLVCLEWENLPLGRSGNPAERDRLGRRLRGIWRPQLQAQGLRWVGLETRGRLRLWVRLPGDRDAARLGRSLQRRARNLLSRDLGRELEWPGWPRVLTHPGARQVCAEPCGPP